MSGDSSSSGPSFWKDSIDGNNSSIHTAKYEFLCESSSGDYTCHSKGLGGKEIDKSARPYILYKKRMNSTLDPQTGGSDPTAVVYRLGCPGLMEAKSQIELRKLPRMRLSAQVFMYRMRHASILNRSLSLLRRVGTANPILVYEAHVIYPSKDKFDTVVRECFNLSV
ncbi:hypothetical protein ASPTUDRAFT_30157 [Aspergillus tubingensis CBS 134.48]|uniref:Uncharacterized protein n=1 Tax=Aspergillus tubingensis (strain CBS 134.48) TaxID=767770 RepID=A0A1L9N4S1_ASPTC|nr:hypothetical protein ASPTUDRAFT_30157 [Aspergillus tubingensis CBS 134.48]